MPREILTGGDGISGETGLEFRDKLNSNFEELYNKEGGIEIWVPEDSASVAFFDPNLIGAQQGEGALIDNEDSSLGKKIINVSSESEIRASSKILFKVDETEKGFYFNNKSIYPTASDQSSQNYFIGFSNGDLLSFNDLQNNKVLPYQQWGFYLFFFQLNESQWQIGFEALNDIVVVNPNNTITIDKTELLNNDSAVSIKLISKTNNTANIEINLYVNGSNTPVYTNTIILNTTITKSFNSIDKPEIFSPSPQYSDYLGFFENDVSGNWEGLPFSRNNFGFSIIESESLEYFEYYEDRLSTIESFGAKDNGDGTYNYLLLGPDFLKDVGDVIFSWDGQTNFPASISQPAFDLTFSYKDGVYLIENSTDSNLYNLFQQYNTSLSNTSINDEFSFKFEIDQYLDFGFGFYSQVDNFTNKNDFSFVFPSFPSNLYESVTTLIDPLNAGNNINPSSFPENRNNKAFIVSGIPAEFEPLIYGSNKKIYNGNIVTFDEFGNIKEPLNVEILDPIIDLNIESENDLGPINVPRRPILSNADSNWSDFWLASAQFLNDPFENDNDLTDNSNFYSFSNEGTSLKDVSLYDSDFLIYPLNVTDFAIDDKNYFTIDLKNTSLNKIESGESIEFVAGMSSNPTDENVTNEFLVIEIGKSNGSNNNELNNNPAGSYCIKIYFRARINFPSGFSSVNINNYPYEITNGSNTFLSFDSEENLKNEIGKITCAFTLQTAPSYNFQRESIQSIYLNGEKKDLYSYYAQFNEQDINDENENVYNWNLGTYPFLSFEFNDALGVDALDNIIIFGKDFAPELNGYKRLEIPTTANPNTITAGFDVVLAGDGINISKSNLKQNYFNYLSNNYNIDGEIYSAGNILALTPDNNIVVINDSSSSVGGLSPTKEETILEDWDFSAGLRVNEDIFIGEKLISIPFQNDVLELNSIITKEFNDYTYTKILPQTISVENNGITTEAPLPYAADLINVSENYSTGTTIQNIHGISIDGLRSIGSLTEISGAGIGLFTELSPSGNLGENKIKLSTSLLNGPADLNGLKKGIETIWEIDLDNNEGVLYTSLPEKTQALSEFKIPNVNTASINGDPDANFGDGSLKFNKFDDQVYVYKESQNSWEVLGGGNSGIEVFDEGTSIGTSSSLNFIGADVNTVFNSVTNQIDVYIPSKSLTVPVKRIRAAVSDENTINISNNTIKFGDKLTQIEFEWEYDPDSVDSQSLSGPTGTSSLTLTPSDRIKTLTGLEISNNQNWNFSGQNASFGSINFSIGVTFVNDIYFGKSTEIVLNESQIKNLGLLPSNNDHTRTYDISDNSEAYIYICYPKRLGQLNLWQEITDPNNPINVSTLQPIEIISITNDIGESEDYYLQRSVNQLNGSYIIRTSI